MLRDYDHTPGTLTVEEPDGTVHLFSMADFQINIETVEYADREVNIYVEVNEPAVAKARTDDDE